MKDKKRSIRKELKEPDEFVSFWNRVIGYVLEHKREFAYGAAGAVLLVLLISAGSAYLENRERKAAALFARVRGVLQTAGPAVPAAGLQTGSSSEDPAKKQEAVTTLEMIVDDYSGTSAGQQSRLLLGQVYFERGEHDAALEVYQDLLEKGKVPVEIKALAWEGLAYVHEEKGDVENAIPWYQKLTQADSSYIRPWAWMGLGRCYEQTGQPEQALDAYHRFLADFPNHPQASEAKASISKISQQTPPGSGNQNPAGAETPAVEEAAGKTGP